MGAWFIGPNAVVAVRLALGTQAFVLESVWPTAEMLAAASVLDPPDWPPPVITDTPCMATEALFKLTWSPTIRARPPDPTLMAPLLSMRMFVAHTLKPP